jgi:hypothetical protein
VETAVETAVAIAVAAAEDPEEAVGTIAAAAVVTVDTEAADTRLFGSH